MASGEQQPIGISVKECIVDLGVCSIKLKVYVTALGTYDLIIRMEWLESHQTFIDCYMKRIPYITNEGETTQI